MNFNPSFFWRILLVYAGILVLSISLLLLYLTDKTRADLENSYIQQLQTQAELLAVEAKPYLQSGDLISLLALNSEFSRLTQNRFTIVDNQGVVLADSHDNPARMANHSQRPEIQNAINSGSGQIARFSRTITEDLIYFAVPVFAEGELSGVIRSAAFTSDIDAAFIKERSAIFQKGLTVITIGIILLGLVAYMQARSVEKLALIASDIADGNFKGRVPQRNALGLRKIAEVINQLARSSASNLSDITADRNRLAAIFTGMVEGVIDVDQNQKILHINDAAQKLLGVSAQESTGKAVWQEVRHNEITQALDQAIRTQSVVKIQIKLMFPGSKKDDESIVDIYAASLSDDSGRPIGAVVVLHDISELKSLERIRTDFVANASHELKTPITAIRGLSESAIDDNSINRETLLQFMNRIHSQSIRLSQLVSDLMALSRLEVDFATSLFTTINMTVLLRNSIKLAETAIEQKNQQLTFNYADENIYVKGDRQNISQLVDNLIDNAIKYTPQNGQIVVSLSVENNTNVLLEVSDTGIGISPQYQQRIFERFYRVDKARSRSLGGTGLGLAIAKNIAEKHAGTINLKSQVGRGSTFSYRMPLAEATKQDTPSSN
jgi:two-component system phosphate regulon sensor histidine kinase PhoR